MSAAVTDKFNYASNTTTAPVATTLASQKAVAAASLSLSAATGWPTSTAVHFKLYRVDTAGAIVAGTETIWKGTLSGTTVSNLTLKSGTDQIYAAGSVAEPMPTSAWADDFISGMLVSHNQDGTMITSLPLTTPKITTSINDSGGNEVIKTPATASAVNELTVTNAATGTAVTVTATGGDTNIDLRIGSKGTGVVGFYGNHDGYVLDTDTWTYVSATSFKISGKDVSARFPVGTKLKLTQTTAKYFYVTACTFSTDTTVTVTGGTDYSLANAAITLPNYSYAATPQLFPQYFAYTPTVTAGSGTFTSVAGTMRFAIQGKTVTFKTDITITTAGTASGAVLYTLPVTAQTTSGNIGSGREDVVSGKMISSKLNSSATQASSANYDNTSWIANNSVGRINGSYEAA